MNTFLPYPDFEQSAKCLDNQRLGKQRCEVLQILKALNDPNYGWKNHPAVNMWRGYEIALAHYGFDICDEWLIRGYKDTCFDKIASIWAPQRYYKSPPWLGDERFHLSHQVALFVKNPQHYSKYFGWFDSEAINYYWPSKEKNK